jgi:GNAT superfamily N-acetyltransferase
VDRPSPALRYFRASDLLLERVEPTWWGGVVTDSRFPAIHDLNYARVDHVQPDLTMAEVLRTLLPALEASGALHIHMVCFEPEGTATLLADAERRGHPISWDQVLEFRGPPIDNPGLHRVDEIPPGEDRVWEILRRAYVEFDLHDTRVQDELLEWVRTVLRPTGRRFFVVEGPAGVQGVGSLDIRDGVAYVDDIVTFPEERGRGVATAIVIRIVQEAIRANAESIFLLADAPAAVRLYRGLGFAETGRIASTLAPREHTTAPRP